MDRGSVSLGILLVFFAACGIDVALAENLIEKEYSGSVQEVNASRAREALIQKAAQDTALTFINEIVNDASAIPRSVLETKLLSQWQKYIPFVKVIEIKPENGGGFRGKVSMKVALQELKSLVASQGLLFRAQALPSIITFLTVTDRGQMRSVRSWTQEGFSSAATPNVESLQLGVERNFTDLFWEKGFYFQPFYSGRMGAQLPDALKKDRIRRQDVSRLGAFYASELVLLGEVIFAQDPRASDLKLSLYHAPSSRVIAEVNRKVDSADWARWVPALGKELVDQAYEAWQAGALGTDVTVVRIEKSLSYQEVQSVKSSLLRNGKVTVVRERLFTPEFVEFEIESTVSKAELFREAQSMPMSLNGRPLRLKKAEEGGDQGGGLVFSL